MNVIGIVIATALLLGPIISLGAWILALCGLCMKMGTRSLLFGAHMFWLHPWFVMIAWFKLYGFPRHPAIWASFFLHDIGYWGKAAMDDEEGELHPTTGALLVSTLFDLRTNNTCAPCKGTGFVGEAYCPRCFKWFNFSYYHSRFLSKRDGVHYSQLCVADKLAIALTPWWLYIPTVRASGEWREYVKEAQDGKYATMNLASANLRVWYKSVQDYLLKWSWDHRDMREDLATPTRGHEPSTVTTVIETELLEEVTHGG